MPALFKTKRNPADLLVPEGIFRFTIEGAKERPAIEEGKYPLVALQLRVIVNGQKHQAIVWDNLSTSPKSLYRVHQILDSVGAPNEDGEIGADWFRNKSGWASFVHEYNQNDLLVTNVKQYLTEKQAETAIERMRDREQEEGGAMRVQTKRTSRPAPSSEEPAVKKSKKMTVVDAHGDDEDIPF